MMILTTVTQVSSSAHQFEISRRQPGPRLAPFSMFFFIIRSPGKNLVLSQPLNLLHLFNDIDCDMGNIWEKVGFGKQNKSIPCRILNLFFLPHKKYCSPLFDPKCIWIRPQASKLFSPSNTFSVHQKWITDFVTAATASFDLTLPPNTYLTVVAP